VKKIGGLLAGFRFPVLIHAHPALFRGKRSLEGSIPNPLNHNNTKTQRAMHGEDLLGQVLLCAIVSLW
jgi:hypothetical protein